MRRRSVLTRRPRNESIGLAISSARLERRRAPLAQDVALPASWRLVPLARVSFHQAIADNAAAFPAFGRQVARKPGENFRAQFCVARAISARTRPCALACASERPVSAVEIFPPSRAIFSCGRPPAFPTCRRAAPAPRVARMKVRSSSAARLELRALFWRKLLAREAFVRRLRPCCPR